MLRAIFFSCYESLSCLTSWHGFKCQCQWPIKSSPPVRGPATFYRFLFTNLCLNFKNSDQDHQLFLVYSWTLCTEGNLPYTAVIFWSQAQTTLKNQSWKSLSAWERKCCQVPTPGQGRVWTPGLAGIWDLGPNSEPHGNKQSFPETCELALVAVKKIGSRDLIFGLG